MDWLIDAIKEQIKYSNEKHCKCELEGDTNGREAWSGYTGGLRWVLSTIEIKKQEQSEQREAAEG